jgi:hypothetical protein
LLDDKDPYDLASYEKYKGKQYAMDLFVKEAINFIQANKKSLFFLYLAFTVPHAAIQVPDDSLKEYLGLFPETPYKGEKGYLPHPAPRAGYAAMITRIDREIGRVSDHISAFWDFLPTFTELVGIKTPPDIDGISIMPELLGRVEKQKKHEYLYWEYNGSQAVRLADWKALRQGVDKEVELFDLEHDISEKYNMAAENPKIVTRILEIMEKGRTKSELFPLKTKRI